MASRVTIWLASTKGRPSNTPSLLAGYPSALVAVATLSMDGIVGTGTLLGTYGDGWQDRLVGWAVVSASLAYVCHIIYTTTRKFPRGSLSVVPIEAKPPFIRRLDDSDTSDELKDPLVGITTETLETALEEADLELDSILSTISRLRSSTNSGNSKKIVFKDAKKWLREPTHEWIITPGNSAASLAEGWVLRYQSYIADSRVSWYCGLEQWGAVLICMLGSLKFSQMPYCITRGVLCILQLGAQTTVMVLMRPPVQRWRWLLMSIVLSLQTVTGALSVANASLQEQEIEFAMDVIGIFIFALLGISTVSDIVILLLELRIAAMKALSTIKTRGWKRLPDADEEIELGENEHTDKSSATVQPLSIREEVQPLGAAQPLGEEAVVRIILSQLQEYEADLLQL
eukprot:GILJ01025889.1.p1 GENE.GILJ01025889.1~~GILJ01025889.1.p1  ORF type:complete len:426 (+),score=40.29 GILJ01025889.1:79-1278(+)